MAQITLDSLLMNLMKSQLPQLILVKEFTSCALHAISSSTLSQPHHLLFLQLRSCFSIACDMPLWLRVCGTTLVPLVRTCFGSVQLWCGSGLVTLILLFLFYSQTI